MKTFVPHDQLQPETLWAVIEEFVTRDGAIQGQSEPTLAEKMQAVQSSLLRGDVVLIFDNAEESLSIVATEEWSKSSAADRLHDSNAGDGD